MNFQGMSIMTSLLFITTPAQSPQVYKPVAISCDSAISLMDIVKNSDIVWERLRDNHLEELRENFVKHCV